MSPSRSPGPIDTGTHPGRGDGHRLLKNDWPFTPLGHRRRVMQRLATWATITGAIRA